MLYFYRYLYQLINFDSAQPKFNYPTIQTSADHLRFEILQKKTLYDLVGLTLLSQIFFEWAATLRGGWLD